MGKSKKIHLILTDKYDKKHISHFLKIGGKRMGTVGTKKENNNGRKTSECGRG